VSTADEILARMADAEARLAPVRAALDESFRAMSSKLIVMTFGREVSPRRARKLRRRGELVEFTRRTGAGSKRFRWLPPVKFAFVGDTNAGR
jgi:hypothetical protein